MALHVIFYENVSGEIQLPPTSDTPCPRGFITREANTLPEIDALQLKLQQDLMRREEQAIERDELMFADRRKRTFDSLMNTLQSSATLQYEKDFIRTYLEWRVDKRKQFHQKFICDRAYFVAREFDNPDEHIARSIGE